MVTQVVGRPQPGSLGDEIDGQVRGFEQPPGEIDTPFPHPGATWVFIIFYGLDWVATVPPTIAIYHEYFGADTPVVFGWVFASHQLGAAVAAFGAGYIRDAQGSYDNAFHIAAGLCILAATCAD